MSDSPWSEYLQTYANYLDSGRTALKSGGRLPAEPKLARPSCPLPQDQAWVVLGLLADAAKALSVPETEHGGLIEACQGLSAKVRRRTRQHGSSRASKARAVRTASDDLAGFQYAPAS